MLDFDLSLAHDARQREIAAAGTEPKPDKHPFRLRQCINLLGIHNGPSRLKDVELVLLALATDPARFLRALFRRKQVQSEVTVRDNIAHKCIPDTCQQYHEPFVISEPRDGGMDVKGRAKLSLLKRILPTDI